MPYADFLLWVLAGALVVAGLAGLGQAGRAGLGATLGLVVGAALKLALGFTMPGVFLLARLY